MRLDLRTAICSDGSLRARLGLTCPEFRASARNRAFESVLFAARALAPTFPRPPSPLSASLCCAARHATVCSLGDFSLRVLTFAISSQRLFRDPCAPASTPRFQRGSPFGAHRLCVLTAASALFPVPAERRCVPPTRLPAHTAARRHPLPPLVEPFRRPRWSPRSSSSLLRPLCQTKCSRHCIFCGALLLFPPFSITHSTRAARRLVSGRTDVSAFLREVKFLC